MTYRWLYLFHRHLTCTAVLVLVLDLALSVNMFPCVFSFVCFLIVYSSVKPIESIFICPISFATFVEGRMQQCDNFGELKYIKQVEFTDQLNDYPTGALILMHGSGDNGGCFRRQMSYLLGSTAAFRHIRIIYPTAPLTPYSPANGIPVKTWFDVSNYSMEAKENQEELDRVGKDLMQIIDSQANCGIPRSRIAVAGFSRGGAMSFHLGYRLAPDLAAVGVMSSWLPYSSDVYQFLRYNAGQKWPVLLQQHGDDDDLVDISLARTTFDELSSLGVKGRFVSLSGQGHELSRGEIQQLFRFISDAIPE